MAAAATIKRFLGRLDTGGSELVDLFNVARGVEPSLMTKG
jgi:hypothetical protein